MPGSLTKRRHMDNHNNVIGLQKHRRKHDSEMISRLIAKRLYPFEKVFTT